MGETKTSKQQQIVDENFDPNIFSSDMTFIPTTFYLKTIQF